VFVVGEIRDKKGFFRRFVDYTTECFEKSGARKYNELILLNVVGSASRRAKAAFKSRKCVKVHQNVLVFYKGDPKKIKENFGEIEIDESLFEDYAEE
jgi:hypothetical protein